MKKKIRIIIIACFALIVLFFVARRLFRSDVQDIRFETVKVKKGNIYNSITATGTIQAVKTVEVGTQVSGEISKIYVDYNSKVKAGQLLAELDQKPLQTTLTIAGASLDNAKAEMKYQEATYERTKALFTKNMVAESEYDLASYNYEKAKASLKTAQLNYDKAKINLDYAFIFSPIDGVILERAVNEGQTVAASFSTPTLFTIAHDLKRMQVEASIDEADIGQVKDGQKAVFTVDAFPDLEFTGKVVQIRLQPITVSNVVTYTVIVEAYNPDLKLMPGMTANLEVYIDEAENVLIMSDNTLYFKPDNDMLAAYRKRHPDTFKKAEKKGRVKPDIDSFKPTPERKFPGPPPDNDNNQSDFKTVWVKNGTIIHPVRIKTGIDNGINVEVLSGLKEGTEVITAMNYSKSEDVKKSDSSSPFMPRPPSRRKK